MRTNLIIITFILCASAAYSQKEALKYGIEVGLKPFHEDYLTERVPFTLSGFAGCFFEYSFFQQFSVNISAGIHNVYTKVYFSDEPPGGISHNNKLREKPVFRTTFEVKIDPRFYIFTKPKPWGNLYGSISLAYETGCLQPNRYKPQRYSAIPTIGYQLNLSKHFYTEVYGGIGWSKVCYLYDCRIVDYSIGARLRYSFKSL